MIWKSKHVTRPTKVRLLWHWCGQLLRNCGSEGCIIHNAKQKQIEAFNRGAVEEYWEFHGTNE